MIFHVIITKLNLRKVKYLGYYYTVSRWQNREWNPVQTSSLNCSRMHNADAIYHENKFHLLIGSSQGRAQLVHCSSQSTSCFAGWWSNLFVQLQEPCGCSICANSLIDSQRRVVNPSMFSLLKNIITIHT